MTPTLSNGPEAQGKRALSARIDSIRMDTLAYKLDALLERSRPPRWGMDQTPTERIDALIFERIGNLIGEVYAECHAIASQEIAAEERRAAEPRWTVFDGTSHRVVRGSDVAAANTTPVASDTHRAAK